MEEWLTEVQVPHGPWPDGSPELAPDEVGPVVHVRPRQSQWGPEGGEILYLVMVNLSKLFPCEDKAAPSYSPAGSGQGEYFHLKQTFMFSFNQQ